YGLEPGPSNLVPSIDPDALPADSISFHPFETSFRPFEAPFPRDRGDQRAVVGAAMDRLGEVYGENPDVRRRQDACEQLPGREAERAERGWIGKMGQADGRG